MAYENVIAELESDRIRTIQRAKALFNQIREIRARIAELEAELAELLSQRAILRDLLLEINNAKTLLENTT
jgi:chaperonin cofactor prefoldin